MRVTPCPTPNPCSRQVTSHPPELPTPGLEREGLAQERPQVGQVSAPGDLQDQGKGALYSYVDQGLRVTAP